MKKILYFIAFTFVIFSCQSPTQPENTSTSASTQSWNAEEKIKELNLQLPEIGQPIANYVHVVRTGNLLFLAGKGPALPDGTYITGKVGTDLSVEDGQEAARVVGLQQLAVLKQELGDLNKVKRIVKVLGMVNCGSDFTQHSQVINGFSDLMVEVFGEKGKHARSAVGMTALPSNIAVEIELIVEFED
jgi:enamine deaminase RidA (YjgF/YER057c/UK114 family)